MLDDQIRRLKDPRIRRPMIGVAASYLVWAALAILVSSSGLSTGSAAQRWVVIGLLTAPILAMALFFARLHAEADEVERAMYATAAAFGFVLMLLAGFIGMLLDALHVQVRLSAMHIWSVGMLAWLVGLWRAFRGYQ